MSELETLLAEVRAIAARPVIPADVALWDSAHIAAYLNRSTKRVTQSYAVMQGFPKAIRLPTTGKGLSDPLWRAKDVIAWAEKYFEKK